MSSETIETNIPAMPNHQPPAPRNPGRKWLLAVLLATLLFALAAVVTCSMGTPNFTVTFGDAPVHGAMAGVALCLGLVLAVCIGFAAAIGVSFAVVIIVTLVILAILGATLIALSPFILPGLLLVALVVWIKRN